MPGHYTLEVTSPGVERALRTPAHFRREIGKVVAIRLADVGHDDRRVTGTLIAADDTSATVAVDGPEGTVRAHRPPTTRSTGRRPSSNGARRRSPARARSRLGPKRKKEQSS